MDWLITHWPQALGAVALTVGGFFAFRWLAFDRRRREQRRNSIDHTTYHADADAPQQPDFQVPNIPLVSALTQTLPIANPPLDVFDELWIVFNPSKHDDPAAFQERVEETAHDLGINRVHWYATTIEDPGTGQAIRALADGATIVVAAGGDGTVRAVAAGMAGTGVRMAILPVGTGNLLAQNLHVPIGNLSLTLATAIGQHHMSVDLSWLRMEDTDSTTGQPAEGGLVRQARERLGLDLVPVNTRADEAPRADEYAFVIVGGMGFDGETMVNTESDMKKRIGWLAYILGALPALSTAPIDVHVTLNEPHTTSPAGPDLPLSVPASVAGVITQDDVTPLVPTATVAAQESTELTARSIMFANCPDIQTLVLAPDATVDDGLLDVVAVDTQAGLWGWAELSIRILMQGAGLRTIHLPMSTGHIAFRQAPSGSVTASTAQVVEVDGDPLGTARTIHARVQPGALDIAVPPGG